jgi:triacylglycerol esterase/lipase EstA (alpha/beta hydrolase family)
LSVEDGAQDRVLVGHSHGGMVISGVADRIPERVDDTATAHPPASLLQPSHELDGQHNPMRATLEDLLRILLDVADRPE